MHILHKNKIFKWSIQLPATLAAFISKENEQVTKCYTKNVLSTVAPAALLILQLIKQLMNYILFEINFPHLPLNTVE